MPNCLEDIKTKILHPKIGLEISGIDLTQVIPDEILSHIIDLFNKHAVILFRNQPLTDEQQIEFSRLFGTLEPTSIMKAATNQFIYQISNIDNRGKVLSAGSKKRALLEVNTNWHIDSSYKSPPALASILSAREIPESESSFTEFCSLISAYKNLTKEDKQTLHGLVCIHDYNYSLNKKNDNGVPQHEKEALQPCEQPLVHIHSGNGATSLYLSSHITSIKDLPLDMGRKIVNDLIKTCANSTNIYRHEWQQNDLLIWDNRCVMHRSTGIPYKEVRRAHRTTVCCEKPLVAI
jgi:alpha-ketoglutarate-dependent 2,4-dichlorophenoxyacetate dioxygenase